MVTYLIITDILLVAIYLFKDLFSLALIKTSIIFLLITITGFLAGSYLRNHVPSKHFKAIVILVLALNSLKIIFDLLF